MRPAEPGELLEYGQLMVCMCSRLPARDACNRPVTRHLVLLVLATVVAAYSCALLIALQAASVPWVALTAFNGTTSNLNVWRMDDRYALDGSVQSAFCPATRSPSPCVLNPSWHVAPRLQDIAPTADMAGARARMEPLGAAALALWALAALALVAGVWPTARLPPGKREGWTPPTSVRLALVCGFAAAAAGVVGVFMGVPSDLVMTPLATNTTAVTVVDSDPQVPSAAAGLPLLQLSPGSGYPLSAAALGLLAVLASFMVVGCAVSPRWACGTRAAFYDAQLAAGLFVAPESEIVDNPCACDGGAALLVKLEQARAQRLALAQQAHVRGAGAWVPSAQAPQWGFLARGAPVDYMSAPQPYAPGGGAPDSAVPMGYGGGAPMAASYIAPSQY